MGIEKIRELVSLIKTSDSSTSDKKRAIANLKRLFGFHMQDVKARGKNLSPEIKKEIESLLSNYESVKDFEGINEILSSIASEYLELADNTSNSSFMDKALDIHIKILGNPGTESKDFDPDYIEKVIIGKLDSKTSFNKLDIINILKEQGETLSQDFQNLIEEIVMPDIKIDIENPDIETRKLKNPEILDVLSNLAASYRYDAKFEKTQEILEKALKLTQFEDDYLYKNIKEEFNKINTLNMNFDIINLSNTSDSCQEFTDTIKNHLGVETINSPTFVQPTSHTPRNFNPNPSPSPSIPAYKMPFEKKCEAIYTMIERLKKDHPDIDFDELKVGKNTFDSYHIITLKNANFTILENFNDSNEAIYLIDNDILYSALQETKTDAKQKFPDKILSANHIQDFDQYLDNLTKKASSKLKSSPGKSDKQSKISRTAKPEHFSTNTSEKPLNSESISEKIVVDEPIIPEQTETTSEIDLTSLSVEELENLSVSYDTEIAETDAETAKLESSIESLEDQHREEDMRQELIKRVLAKKSELENKKHTKDQLKNKESELKKSLANKIKNNRTPHDIDS